MSIKTGRFGLVEWDPVPASPVNPVALISINGWKLDTKQNYEDVTCFLDTNKVYVPDLIDISGSLQGLWNSDNVALFAAAKSGTPGYVRLIPNNDEPSFTFEGLAYLDASIDCSLKAPKISGNIKAAGPWILPG